MMNKPATRQAGRIFLTGLLVVNLMLGYLGQATIAQAQIIKDPIDTTKTGVPGSVPTYSGVENSIRDYLCVPDDSNLGTALFTCITKLYRFGIAFGAIALVFFVVFAGYMYMAGGETGKGKAKGVLLSAITGMAIMLSSYVLLNFINPDLVKIKPIQPPIFSASDLPSCESVGYGKDCVLSNGQIQIIGNGGSTPGSANEAKYKTLIAKYAPRLANNSGVHPYCALASLVNKESSFRYNIASNAGPSGTYNTINIDVNSANKKFYNLTFLYYGGGGSSATIGHGIGLGQIFIYGPPAQWRSKGWPDALTPARSSPDFFGSSTLTVTDLLDPDKNLDASSFYFAKLMQNNGGNIVKAYRSYSGGEPDFQTGSSSFYNQCVLRQ
jgi:hypothetical protein